MTGSWHNRQRYILCDVNSEVPFRCLAPGGINLSSSSSSRQPYKQMHIHLDMKLFWNIQCRASYSARFEVSLTTMSQGQPIPRPLLPKPPTLPFQARLQACNLDPRLQEQPNNSSPQAKRTQVRVACGACQKKKVKASQPLATAFRWWRLTVG